MNFLRRLQNALTVLWPTTALRIMQRGSEEIAKFRAEHGREPTDAEWTEISRRVDAEVTSSRPATDQH
jgi:hypothetical protein